MKKIVGHYHAKRKLIENISLQSWLVSGKRGIGKATLIKSFSNWFISKNYSKSSLDINLVEGETVGIEKIRQIKNFLYLTPIKSEYKIVIIDSLESMTNNAKNAILKILEEPPRNSKIFIINHEPFNIKNTIKCRCFQLNLTPLNYHETKKIVLSECKLLDDNKIFDEIIIFLCGMPGIIIDLINNNKYELYKNFHKLLSNLRNQRAIIEVINSELDLEITLNMIQTFILNKIKKETKNNIGILLSKWKKIEYLFSSAKKFRLDKKNILTNAINIII